MHPYRTLITGSSGSGKTNALFNLIKEKDDINKIYLYARNLSEAKYEFLIKKREDTVIKHLNECSNTVDDVYENIDEYNPTRKIKILIIFDDVIAVIMANKKIKALVKELFIRFRKLNVSLVFIKQSYFPVPKVLRLKSTHYLIMKINKTITKYCNDSFCRY